MKHYYCQTCERAYLGKTNYDNHLCDVQTDLTDTIQGVENLPHNINVGFDTSKTRQTNLSENLGGENNGI